MRAYELIGDRGPINDEWGLTQFPEWEIGNEVKNWLDNYPLHGEDGLDEHPRVEVRAVKVNYLIEVFATNEDGTHGVWDTLGDSYDVEEAKRTAEKAMREKPAFIRDWRVVTHWEARSLWQNPDQDPIIEAGVDAERVR